MTRKCVNKMSNWEGALTRFNSPIIDRTRNNSIQNTVIFRTLNGNGWCNYE